MTLPHQLVFSFPDVVQYGRDHFIALPENEVALKLIESAPDWSQYGLILNGPPQSGKTHLSWIFQKKMRAAFIHEHHLNELGDGHDLIEHGRAYILDGADTLIPKYPDTMFHLINLVKEKRSQILITLRKGVRELSPILPDVRSRLLALPHVELALSEEGARLILVKRLSDQQIQVPPAVVEYIFTHFSRRLDDVVNVLHQLNQESLRYKKPISRAMLRAFLE